MARPKSDAQNVKHEEDALRDKAVTESRQGDIARGVAVAPFEGKVPTDRTHEFKIDQDRSVNASDKEAEQHHARHSKTEPDQKPTAESNLSDHLRNAMPVLAEGDMPADKRMHISDDLAMELSSKFAHHEIRYTDSGIDVLSGGESISIDKNRIGKFDTRADLRAYIDALPVIRHG